MIKHKLYFLLRNWQPFHENITQKLHGPFGYAPASFIAYKSHNIKMRKNINYILTYN